MTEKELQRKVIWEDPGLDGNSIRNEMTVEEILKLYRSHFAKDPAKYAMWIVMSDEYLITEFMTIHWAWYEDEERGDDAS